MPVFLPDRCPRFLTSTILLLAVSFAAGCGGDDTDFSKPPGPAPTARPKSPDEKPTGDSAADKAQADAAKQPDQKAAAPPKSKDPSSTAAADVAPPKKKIEFDLSWLTERDQVTAFSDDGTLVAVGSGDGRLRMFDVGAGAVRDVFRTESLGISQVVVAPGNHTMAAITADGHLRLHTSGTAQGFDQYQQSRLRNRAQQRGLGAHVSPVTASAWHPNGQVLATAAADASIHLWDVPLKDAVELATNSEPLAAVAVNKENDVILTVAQSGQVRLLDFTERTLLNEFAIKDAGTVTQAALVADSDLVLIGTREGSILAYSSVRGTEVARLYGHKGEVTCLTVAADNRSFLSADSVGQLRLWRLPLNGSTQLARFGAEVDVVQVTEDRRHAAAIVRGKGLFIVRLTTPPVMRPVSGQSDDVQHITFTQIGSVLAGATRTGAVRFWSVPDGDLIAESTVHRGEVHRIEAHPRNQAVVTAGNDGMIHLLEVPSRLPKIRNVGSAMTSLSTSTNGLILAARGDNGQIRLWQMANGSQIGQVGGMNGKATTFTIGSKWIAVGDESGAIRFLTTDSIQPDGDVQPASAPITSLSLAEEAGVAYALDAKGVIRELTLPPGAPDSIALKSPGTTALRAIDNGRQAIVASSDLSLKRLDLTQESAAETSIGTLNSPATLVAATNTGTAVLTGHSDGSVELHANNPSTTFRVAIDESTTVNSVAIDSETQKGLTAHSDGTVREWNLTAVALSTFDNDDSQVRLVSLSHDGQFAAVATSKNTLAILQTSDSSVISEHSPFKNPITAVAWERDGKHIIAADSEGLVRRSEAATGKDVGDWDAGSPISSIASVPDGKRFLVGFQNGAIQTWTTETGPGVELRPADEQQIGQVVVTGKSSLLVLAGSTIEQWDTQKRSKVKDFEISNVSSIVDAATSNTRLIGTADGKVHVINRNDEPAGEVSAGTQAERVLLVGATESGTSFSVNDAGRIAIWNNDNPKPARINVGTKLLAAATDPSGKAIAIVTEDGTLQVLRLPLVQTYQTSSSSCLAAQFVAGEENSFLTIGADGQLTKWQNGVAAEKKGRRINIPDTTSTVAISSDGSTVAGLSNSQAFLWQTDATSNDIALLKELPGKARWIRLSANGNRLVVGLDNTQAWLINTSDHSVVERIRLSDGIMQTADITSDGFGLITGGSSSQLRVYQPAVRRVLTSDADPTATISFNATSQQLSIVSPDGSVQVWGQGTQPVVDRTAADGQRARHLAVSGNGEWIAQAFEDNSVATRRTRDGLEPNVFTTDFPIRAIAISHDGQLISLSTDDKTSVYDRSGNPVQVVSQDDPSVAVSFIGQQSTIAISGSDGSISFSAYSRSSAELEVGKPVSGATFSASGTQLASWDADKVRIWNLTTKEELVQFDDAAGGLDYASFADGDRLLVGAGQDDRIYVWSMDQRKLRNDFAAPLGGQRYAITRNGKAIAAVLDDGQLVIHSLANGELLESYDTIGNDVLSLDLRSDDLAVFAGRENGQITEYILSAITSIAAHDSQRVADATFAGKNGFIVSAADDGTVVMHQSGGLKIRSFEGVEGRPVGVSTSPDGNTVYTASADENNGFLRSWRLANATFLAQTSFNLKPTFCRESLTGGRLGLVDKSGHIQMIDTRTGLAGERVATIGPVTDVAIADAADALLTVGDDGAVRAYPFHLVGDFQNAGAATSIDWSHDGKYLAAATSGAISIWDVANSSVVAEIPIKELPKAEEQANEAPPAAKPKTRPRSRRRNPDLEEDAPQARKNLRSKTDDKDNKLAEKEESAADTKTASTPPAPPATLATQVVITPRGELCASFFDGSVRVWDLTEAAQPGTAPLPHTIFRHPSPVMALAIDPLGTKIACGCEDSNIWLWDVKSGQELSRFSGHKGSVIALAFESNGNRLFSTGADRAAKVWPLNQDGSSKDTAAVQIAMADGSAKLRAALEAQLQETEKSEERTRLRSLIRTLESADTDDVVDNAISAADSEISRLRSALREASSVDNRENARRALVTALRERELEKLLTGAKSQNERERLRQEFERMHSTGWNVHRLSTGQPVDKIARADRQLADLPVETSEHVKLTESIQDMLRETPIWPKTPRDTWSRDTTHLLAAVPTDFKFDTKLRPIRLALTSDGLTLISARESATLAAIPDENRQRRKSNDDDEDKKQVRVQGSVRVWDVLTGTELRAWTDVSGSRVHSVNFSGSGDTIYTMPDLFTFRLSTGESRELARRVSMSVGADGRLAAVGLPGRPLKMSDAIRLVDLDAMQFQPVQFAAYESLVPAIALSNDGSTIVAAVRERSRERLIEFDAQTLAERAVLEEFKVSNAWYNNEERSNVGTSHILFSPDDRYVVAYGKRDGGDNGNYRLMAIDMTTRKKSLLTSKQPMIREQSPVPLRFTARQGDLVIDTPTGIHLVNMKDGENLDVVEFRSVRGGTRLVKMTSDAFVAAFADESGVVTLRKLGKDQGSVSFQAHAGPVVGMNFAQGDRMLVTAGEENQIRIWSLAGFYHSRQPPADSAANRAGRNRNGR
ncbi:MAG: WD40 repeat domain-containing protein [Planctomycetota bacterium]|jgi:WD40 repeat protein